MELNNKLVFERLRRIDNRQLTVDNYVLQPCLFENIVLFLTIIIMFCAYRFYSAVKQKIVNDRHTHRNHTARFLL